MSSTKVDDMSINATNSNQQQENYIISILDLETHI